MKATHLRTLVGAILVALVLLSQRGQAQRLSAPDSTTVRLLTGADEPELDELLARVLNIEKLRLQFADARLAGRTLHLTYQEFREGRPGPEQVLAKPAVTQFDAQGRFAFTAYTRQLNEGQVETRFLLPRALVPRTFEAVAGRADQYSLRPDIRRQYRAADQSGRPPQSPASELHLPIGPKVPLLVYTLPYESEGWLLYCDLAQSRVPAAEWYQRFKVLHFVVFYMRVE